MLLLYGCEICSALYRPRDRADFRHGHELLARAGIPLDPFFASEPASDFGQKPRSAFRLVNPSLDEAGGRHVIVALAYPMRVA